MLSVNTQVWNQTANEIREAALKAEHPRTRERLLALYEITQGSNATQVGKKTARNHQTIMKWVHRYNSEGIEALTFKQTGGRPPLFSKKVEEGLDKTIRTALEIAATAPQKRVVEPEPRWTLKRLVKWVKEKFQIDCSRDTLRKTLKKLGFSWKKARKLLNKAKTKDREAFLVTIQGLLDEALHQQCLLVYGDEAHIHLDTDEGYGWSIKGERFWVSSCSPGLQKVSFYGLYLYNLGQVRIFAFDRANQFNTIEMFTLLRAEFPDTPIKMVWDGAPYHRAATVLSAAQTLEIGLQRLPAYSPDFMPVEHLWQWLREDVTYHTCYQSKEDLIKAVALFQERINLDPNAIADRLWVKSHLDSDEEKLRVSS